MTDTRRLLSPVGATLFRAAEYIEQHGWCQGRPMDDSAVCPYWAIHVVAPDLVTKAKAVIAMNHYFGGDMCVWNDTPGRTQAEVVGALRAAALSSPQRAKEKTE